MSRCGERSAALRAARSPALRFAGSLWQRLGNKRLHGLGERGLRETIRRHLDEPAQQLAESLMGRAARYAGGTPDDDMAVVVIKLP